MKRRKKMKAREDRLSDLPDSILIHILSMLRDREDSSKKVVRTCVLSSRWRFLWMSVPVSLEIRFPDNYCDAPRDKWKQHIIDYVTSTHRELHYWRCCEKIKFFSVVFNTGDSEKFVKDVDLWVYFATKLANVEHFELDGEATGYLVPQFAFKNTSWRNLDIQFCKLNPSDNVNWSSLVSLSFRYMYFEEGVMEKVLSGCPNLECLELYRFWGFHHLEINNVKLKKLIMENLETDECDVWLEILAPYIQNLEVLGSCRGICLRNVASLVTAVLDFEFDFNFEDEDPLQRKESTCLNELLHSVAHVENLKLGNRCIEYLSMLELEGWQPPSSSWKFLQLSAELKPLDFPGICSFLRSSSNLETLVINGYRYHSRDLLLEYTNEDEQTRRFETHNFNCSFPNLKTIKILTFYGSVLSLVKYLLKHAKVLEKFIISARCIRNDVSQDYVKMEQELLSFPRSSPHASIIFS